MMQLLFFLHSRWSCFSYWPWYMGCPSSSAYSSRADSTIPACP